MATNDKLQRIEKATVICCPHLEGKPRNQSGFPKLASVYDEPLKLVGEDTYLALCEDCWDKVELQFVRGWMRQSSWR